MSRHLCAIVSDIYRLSYIDRYIDTWTDRQTQTDRMSSLSRHLCAPVSDKDTLN